MKISRHHSQDSQGGGAPPKSVKRSAIPQSLLDKLKDTPEPSKKPVDPNMGISSIPKIQLRQMGDALCCNDKGARVVVVDFLMKNSSALNTGDLAEICFMALDSPSDTLASLFGAIPADRKQEIMGMLFEKVSGIFKSREYDPDLKDKLRKYMDILPHDWKPALVKIAIGSTNYSVELGGLILISEMPLESQPALVRAAIENNSENSLHNGISLIANMPLELQPELIKLVLQNKRLEFVLRASKLIQNVPVDCQPELYRIAGERLAERFTSQYVRVPSSAAEAILAMPIEYSHELANAAIKCAESGEEPYHPGNLFTKAPLDLQPRLIKAALECNDYFLNKESSDLIPTMPVERQPELIKIALQYPGPEIQIKALKFMFSLPSPQYVELHAWACFEANNTQIRDMVLRERERRAIYGA